MAAYVYGTVKMRDPSWVATYRATVPSIVARHGGKYLGRGGKMEKLEGKDKLPDSMVLMEFPTTEQARAFYNDPEYKPFIELRQKGSDVELCILEGI